MASKLPPFTFALRTLRQPTLHHRTPVLQAKRLFHVSPRRLETVTAPVAVRRPVGAFRGGIFGFLLGAVVAGAGTFYYVMEEYRVSNELLTEDIYALQAAVQKIHTYVTTLEEKVDLMERRKK